MQSSRPLATIGLLLSTIVIVTGCSSKSDGTINVNNMQATNTMESNTEGSVHSTTTTYVVPNSLQFPKSIQTYIKKHCRVSIVLPSNLKLDSPIHKNMELAIGLDTSTKSYGMDIFERPKGSRTTQFGLADLVGDMGTVTNLSALNIPGAFNTSRFATHKSVTFSNRMPATYYQNSKVVEYAMIWSIHGWKYIVDVMSGITPKKSMRCQTKSQVLWITTVQLFLIPLKVTYRCSGQGIGLSFG